MYYISRIDLVSRMINIGKLDGKGEDEIRPIDGFIYSSPERDKSCARRVARSRRRVPFSAGEAESLSFLLLRLGTYNKYHISFQLLPIFSPALRYRRRIWRRSLWDGRGAIERWIMAPIKQTLRVLVFSGINYFSDLDSRFIARLQNSRLVSRDAPEFFFVNILTVTLIPVKKSAQTTLCCPRKYFNVYHIDTFNSDALDNEGV